MFTSGTQHVYKWDTTRRTDGGFDKCGTELVARTVGATNMGRQCDKKVQTASFSKTTSDLCTDEKVPILAGNLGLS